MLPHEKAALGVGSDEGYPSWPCRFTHWHPRSFAEAVDAANSTLLRMSNGARIVAALRATASEPEQSEATRRAR